MSARSTRGPKRKATVKSEPKAAAKSKPKAAAKSKPKQPASPVKRRVRSKGKATQRKPMPAKQSAPVVLLSGGNPQIAKADGDAPVQAYIAAMPGWKHDVGRRLDALIVKAVPKVQKAVRWNSPMYGLSGRGFFVAFHVFTHYVKVTFFRGTSLKPLPPGPSKDENTRYVDIREGELDEVQLGKWMKQAAALPGWSPGAT